MWPLTFSLMTLSSLLFQCYSLPLSLFIEAWDIPAAQEDEQLPPDPTQQQVFADTVTSMQKGIGEDKGNWPVCKCKSLTFHWQ